MCVRVLKACGSFVCVGARWFIVLCLCVFVAFPLGVVVVCVCFSLGFIVLCLLCFFPMSVRGMFVWFYSWINCIMFALPYEC